MEAVGYVVRFCEKPNCTHIDETVCANPINTKYFVDPNNLDKIGPIASTNIVVNHDDMLGVVGVCTYELRTNKGIIIRCSIDDKYLIDSMDIRYKLYKRSHNNDIESISVFWKKVLSSFSLSHNPETGHVKHVSLVDMPGRIGTSIQYNSTPDKILLKQRPENNIIPDILATLTIASLSASDRNEYLLRNTLNSLNPKDTSYLTASRDKMSYINTNIQDDFEDEAELRKFLRMRRLERKAEQEARNKSMIRKRRLEDEDNEDGILLMDDSGKRRKLPVDCPDADVSANRSPEQSGTTTELIQTLQSYIKAMENSNKQTPKTEDICGSATNQTEQQSVQQNMPSGSATVTFQRPHGGTEVEAARPRTTTLTTYGCPNKDTIEALAKLITMT